MTTPLLTLDEITRLKVQRTWALREDGIENAYDRLLCTAQEYWYAATDLKRERPVTARAVALIEENVCLRAVVEAATVLASTYDAAPPYELTSEEEALRDAIAALRAAETP